MKRPFDESRRLIVNADDFGRSSSINQAVIESHRQGILTTASLMVTGDALDQAISLARENPRLGVGLHLTLACGRSVLSQREIPGLVDEARNFLDDPVRAGFRYYFRKHLWPELHREIQAQFDKFRSFGLALDHVNGHLNLHLHPAILAILMKQAPAGEIRAFRLTRDPFWLNARLAEGRWLYRISHAVIFAILSRSAEGRLRQRNIRHTRYVFGMLQNAHVDEPYLTRLLKQLPAGDSELYSHPSLDEFSHEFQALIHPQVRRLVESERIKLIRYQDL
jgi:chitin disaccharide deacetylase